HLGAFSGLQEAEPGNTRCGLGHDRWVRQGSWKDGLSRRRFGTVPDQRTLAVGVSMRVDGQAVPREVRVTSRCIRRGCLRRAWRKQRGGRSLPPGLHHGARRKARPPFRSFRSLNSGLASRSGFVRVEVRLQDLLDPVANLLEVGPGGVIDVDVLLVDQLVDLLADLLEMYSRWRLRRMVEMANGGEPPAGADSSVKIPSESDRKTSAILSGSEPGSLCNSWSWMRWSTLEARH